MCHHVTQGHRISHSATPCHSVSYNVSLPPCHWPRTQPNHVRQCDTMSQNVTLCHILSYILSSKECKQLKTHFSPFWQYFCCFCYLLANCQIHTKNAPPPSPPSLALPIFSIQSLQLPFPYCHHHFMGSGGSPFQHELPC